MSSSSFVKLSRSSYNFVMRAGDPITFRLSLKIFNAKTLLGAVRFAFSTARSGLQSIAITWPTYGIEYGRTGGRRSLSPSVVLKSRLVFIRVPKMTRTKPRKIVTAMAEKSHDRFEDGSEAEQMPSGQDIFQALEMISLV